MAKFGKLYEFNSNRETVDAYLEQLFFEANEIPREKQVAVFLSSVGATAYALLRDLLAPTKPKDKSLDDLFKTL